MSTILSLLQQNSAANTNNLTLDVNDVEDLLRTVNNTLNNQGDNNTFGSRQVNENKHENENCTQQTSAPLVPYLTEPIPAYIYNYPQIVDAVRNMHELINDWKSDTNHGKYELEVRFGKWQTQHFQSGVSKNFIEKVLTLFAICKYWVEVSDWEETHDYYYTIKSTQRSQSNQTSFSSSLSSSSTTNSYPIGSSLSSSSSSSSSSSTSLITNPSQYYEIRTTAKFQIDPRTQKKRMITEHIRKMSIKKIDFRHVDQNPSTQTFTPFHHNWLGANYDIRIGLNYEEQVPESDIPSIINPASVRIKSRKSFLYKPHHTEAKYPVWKFDITRSWTGKTKTEAEKKQKNGDTVFEIELECLNPKALMVSPKHDSFYVACSMLLKMTDLVVLVNGPKFKWEPVIRPTMAPDVSCF